jgi:addiction module HigA family antidote
MKDPALKPVHPGEILSEDFLKPLEISQYRLAKDIGVPPRRINEIILGKRGVTADTALRLAHYLGTTPDVWMNLQIRYELDKKRLTISKLIARLPRFAAALA